MDRPRIRQSFKHRKLVLVAGGLFLLSGVAFASRSSSRAHPPSRVSSSTSTK